MSPPQPHEQTNSKRRIYEKNLNSPRSTYSTPSSPIPRTSSPLSNHISTSSSSKSPSDSTDPSFPSTPRGRSSSRYPASLSRVPLHRRGTSKTYERLEDLLREAGYKETRVFTPEAERLEAEAEQRNQNAEKILSDSVRGGVGAVVGFLAGLVPAVMSRNTSRVRALEGETSQDLPRYSPPSSPLAHKTAPEQDVSNTYSLPSASTGYSMNSSASTESLKRSNTTHSSKTYTHELPHHHHPGLRHRPISSAGLPPNHQTYAQASKARVYLRHMASAPNFQPARPRTLYSSRKSATRIRSVTLNDEVDGGMEELQPPLPRTWLETVARAVLFGGAGAYVGGPSSSEDAPGSYAPTLRPTRSSISQRTRPKNKKQSALADHTNRPRASPQFLAPPQCMRVQRGETTSGAISRTRVVCRSAPGSRSGSRVRQGRDAHDLRELWARRRGESDGLPSLTRTRAENDEWDRVPRAERVGRGASRYLNGWGTESVDDGHETGSSEEEEEDGELDLARMLVPPKRQNSIRSLRRHLHAHSSQAGGARASLHGSLRGMRPEWIVGEGEEDDEYNGEGTWTRSSSRLDADRGDAIDDGEGEYSPEFEQALRVGMQRRRGIPGVWSER